MAHIILQLDGKDVDVSKNEKHVKIIPLDKGRIFILGHSDTFRHLENSRQDFIISLGYAGYIDGDLAQQTLSHILNCFDASQIGDLKKKLVGQFVMMIKKHQQIYLFSDFIGGRNIFYSKDGTIVSTSFSLLENLVQTDAHALDQNKVFEYLAMRYVQFPAWIGRFTQHKSIKWLLPNEYMTINLDDSSIQIGSVTFSLDNRKETICSNLANDLLSILKSIIYRSEYKESPVAASITGGRDTRLVAAIAADYYSEMHYRIAVSSQDGNSLKDLKIARKVAKSRGMKLDVYRFQPSRDAEKFISLTEALTPSYNHTITPLVENSHAYALGFGGAFGSQLFAPIPWTTIDDFVTTKLKHAKRFLSVPEDFWDYVHDLLMEEFQRSKNVYYLHDMNDKDYIRLFQIFNAARYASFIMSAYNNSGYQLEPYGTFAALELALQVSPELWGNHKSLSGDALVQKVVMARLNPKLGKILAYSTFRPMIPLSLTTFPLYSIGYANQLAFWARRKVRTCLQKPVRTKVLHGYHISNGWDRPFIDRIEKKYGWSK
ncbi:hypothetical protein JXA70_02835 [candidate division KSB1 bacterium]|nr:hypothetical protein [candidate division KSB1 bacterium]